MIVGLNSGYRDEEKEKLFKAILKAEGIPPEVDEDGDPVDFYSSYGQFEVDSKIGCSYYGYDSDVSYIGLDAEELFKQDMRLSQIKRQFIRKVYEVYRIRVPEESVELIFGEVSSG